MSLINSNLLINLTKLKSKFKLLVIKQQLRKLAISRSHNKWMSNGWKNNKLSSKNKTQKLSRKSKCRMMLIWRNYRWNRKKKPDWIKSEKLQNKWNKHKNQNWNRKSCSNSSNSKMPRIRQFRSKLKKSLNKLKMK